MVRCLSIEVSMFCKKIGAPSFEKDEKIGTRIFQYNLLAVIYRNILVRICQTVTIAFAVITDVVRTLFI